MTPKKAYAIGKAPRTEDQGKKIPWTSHCRWTKRALAQSACASARLRGDINECTNVQIEESID